MDPNQNLFDQRSIAGALLSWLDGNEPAPEDDVRRLCELVIALDHWLSRGGVLPRRWQRPAP